MNTKLKYLQMWLIRDKPKPKLNKKKGTEKYKIYKHIYWHIVPSCMQQRYLLANTVKRIWKEKPKALINMPWKLNYGNITVYQNEQPGLSTSATEALTTNSKYFNDVNLAVRWYLVNSHPKVPTSSDPNGKLLVNKYLLKTVYVHWGCHSSTREWVHLFELQTSRSSLHT